MCKQTTHRDNQQLVPRAELRRVLRAAGESCFCAPDVATEWDAGKCPDHGCDTLQLPEELS